MKDNRELKALVKSWEKDLSRLIANWNLIPGSPNDEFELLTHKIIGHLTKGVNKEKLCDILESELVITYGLSPTKGELERFAIEVTDWWSIKG